MIFTLSCPRTLALRHRSDENRDFEYRKRLAIELPTLTQIDATQVAR